MAIPFLEFKAQYAAIKEEIDAAVHRVLDRGWYILGEEGEAFEAEFAAWLGVEAAAGVGSGAAAIQLALMAAGVQAGDEVIAPANTCVPTIAAIANSGATPVLADCDPQTLTLSPEAVNAALTPDTTAIVPVHLYGQACDMDRLTTLAARRNLILIEDCAQAHGAAWKGRPCGGFGAAGAFSFYPTKNLGAFGDAGAVAGNDPILIERVRTLRNYGQDSRYTSALRGVNSRLDELQAAILRVKLRHIDAWNEQRRLLAMAYREGLTDIPWLSVPKESPDARHSHHLFVIRSSHRDALCAWLEAHGVGALIHYPIPIHQQEAWRDLGHHPGDFPHAEAACAEVLSLPLYPELELAQIEEVTRLIRSFNPEQPHE